MNNNAPDPCLPPVQHRQDVASPPVEGAANFQLTYPWRDAAWMQSRGLHQGPRSPIAIYEVHPTSWMRVPEEADRFLTYRELAPKLADYVQRHGFTHVQLSSPLPPDSAPGSTAAFSWPDTRQGAQEFMLLIDLLHQEGIGIILRWSPSPSPFPSGENDAAAPSVDYTRPDARRLHLSTATTWLRQFHIDGLFVDLDELGQLSAENSGVIEFLQQFNEAINREFPDVQTWAKLSTDEPRVLLPVSLGGFGFGFKWDSAWKNDTMSYLSLDPIHRKHHHELLTRREPEDSKNERCVLALSEEDGRGPSILTRIPGDEWQRFATLRLLLAYQWALPGKKLLFMGTEFGQWSGWDPHKSLDWHLVEPRNIHNGVQKLAGHLNWLYRHEPALHRWEDSRDSFEWVDKRDTLQSTLAFLRKSDSGQGDLVLALFNFTPVPRHNARFGVPRGGYWREVLNTDSVDYGGSGQGNFGGLESSPFGWQSRPHSIHVTLPPLAAVYFRQTASDPGPTKPGAEA